jgi:hypothetical protein
MCERRNTIQAPCDMKGMPLTSYERSQPEAEMHSPTNEVAHIAVRPAKKRGVARTLEGLNAKIIELERTVALKYVDQSQAAQ